MANPLRGEVDWVVGKDTPLERTYTLRLSIGDLAQLDNAEEGKDGCMALVNRLLTRHYGLNDLTSVLMRAIKTGMKVNLRREEVYELIDEAGFDEATSVVIDVLNKRLNKEKPEEKNPEELNGAGHPLAAKPIGSD